MAFVETCNGFSVYSKDESQDFFAVLLKAGLNNECMASRNSGQRRAGDQGSRTLQRGVRWSLAGITQTVSPYGRLKGMHRISICTALTHSLLSVPETLNMTFWLCKSHIPVETSDWCNIYGPL
jgi:hypothetical protein